MSDSSQGPGWWQASDGRWYPPQSHPTQQAAPPPAAPPQAVPPAYVGPLAPATYGTPVAATKKSGMPGWAKVVLILGGILVLLVGGCTVAVGLFANKVSNDLTKGCSILSKADAKKAFEGEVTTLQIGGFTSIANAALDTRVIKDAPSCLVTPTGKDAKFGLSRVAKLESSDAKAIFAKELKNAQGTSTDQGNGLTVDSEAYLSEEKVTLGDEAFCTTAALTSSAGALVRKGNTLVYVSVAATTAQAQDVSNTGLGEIEAANCGGAQKVIKAILNI
jgi:hypothetical protein